MRALRFSALLNRFRRDESGTLVAEALMVLPMMIWAYMALFVYWDAYRSINTTQKAAYTVSDMISREMVTLPANYADGMRNLMAYLIDSDQSVAMRVTQVTWNEANHRYQVDWSKSPNNAMPLLTTGTISTVASKIPNLADGDRVVLVETTVNYHSAFDVGLTDEPIRQFVVTRPRFVPKLCITGIVCS